MSRGSRLASAMLATTGAALALGACGSSGGASSGGSQRKAAAASSNSGGATGPGAVTRAPAHSPAAGSAATAPASTGGTSTPPSRSHPLTKPGTTLKLGQTATVQWDNGNPPEYTFAITVSSITPGSMGDFKDVSLTGVPKGASPTYVRLTITNVGSRALKTSVGDPAYSMGVQEPGGLDGDVSMTGDFPPCPQVDSPSAYLPGKTFTTCQIYMERGTVEQVGYDGSTSTIDTPILWSAQ